VSRASTLRPARLYAGVEPYLFVAPTVVLLGGLLVYPVLYILWTSVSTFDVANFGPGAFVGLRHYRAILIDPYFWGSVRVTTIFLAAALPLQVILGFAIGFLVSVPWPGRRVVQALFIVPMVVTPVAAGMIWKMLLDPLWGYVNYLWSLVGGTPVVWFGRPGLALASIVIIDTWQWTPFVVLMAVAGIASLPPEPLEAAFVDGAGPFSRLRHVTLPLLRPVILATVLVRWLGAIKVFDVVYATTKGGPGTATQVLNLYIYDTAFRRLAFDRASAMVTVLVAVSLGLTVLYMRWSEAREP
jgi:multiple sugar transport system permease protein